MSKQSGRSRRGATLGEVNPKDTKRREQQPDVVVTQPLALSAEDCMRRELLRKILAVLDYARMEMLRMQYGEIGSEPGYFELPDEQRLPITDEVTELAWAAVDPGYDAILAELRRFYANGEVPRNVYHATPGDTKARPCDEILRDLSNGKWLKAQPSAKPIPKQAKVNSPTPRGDTGDQGA